MPKIESFEAACSALGLNPLDIPVVEKLPVKHQKAIVAHYKLVIIAEALNEGWEPNWNDYNEYKYYPWWDMETYGDAPAGSGFSFNVIDYAITGTNLGSRLVYKTPDLATFAAKQFIDLYRDLYKIG